MHDLRSGGPCAADSDRCQPTRRPSLVVPLRRPKSASPFCDGSHEGTRLDADSNGASARPRRVETVHLQAATLKPICDGQPRRLSNDELVIERPAIQLRQRIPAALPCRDGGGDAAILHIIASQAREACCMAQMRYDVVAHEGGSAIRSPPMARTRSPPRSTRCDTAVELPASCGVLGYSLQVSALHDRIMQTADAR